MFKDNSGALEMAIVYKFRLHTKYINIKLYHFCNYMTRDKVIIKSINTTDQLADYLTKLVTAEILLPLHIMMLNRYPVTTNFPF